MKECLRYFPRGFEPRKQQIKSLEFVVDTFFKDDKKFAILELPTGVGKSFIATTMSDYIHSMDMSWKSYILTTQIILQKQYQRDFEQYANISSKNNYVCDVFKESNCGEMAFIHKYGNVPKCERCVYSIAKEEFLNNSVSITNTAYFIANILYNEDMIKKRKLMVLDECHNLEEQIISHKAIELNYKTLHRDYGYEEKHWIPDEKTDVFNWILDKFYLWVEDKRESITNVIENKHGGLTLAKNKIIELSKKLEYLDNLVKQLSSVLDNFDPRRWVVENRLKDKVVVISPIYAADFANDLVFSKADKILMMSGTILDKQTYCNTLGINVKDCNFISLDSPFPVENRKIFVIGSGSMSRKNIDNTLPILIKDIDKILDIHKDDKGIIHVSSHYIAKRIFDETKSDRLVIVDDFKNRDEMLEHHYDTKNDTVLISPSLMEGLDLKDELSRFQIIAKIPYPNLGSKYISTKKDLIMGWYAYQTAKSLVQSYGRSVRGMNDYAVTYILDSDFDRFYKYNKKMLPKYFKEAISHGAL